MSMVENTSETNEYHMQGFIQGIFVRWGEHLAGVYLGGGQGGGAFSPTCSISPP